MIDHAARFRQPELSLAFTVEIDLAEPVDLGMAGGITRRIVPITGGRVAGPRLTGEVLPGGADWQVVRPDGVTDIQACYTLRATDGTAIAVDNIGVRAGPAAVLARIARGEDVDPDSYYFRTTPRFDVDDASAHAWLGRTLFVATAARFARRVVIDVYAMS